MAHVSALYIYPVKSCAGVRLTQAELLTLGLRYDRRFMIVDADTRTMVTQRDEPRLAHVVATVNASAQRLSLSTPDGTAQVPLAAEADDAVDLGRTAPTTVPVKVWDDVVPGEIQRGEPSDLLSSWLGRAVLLVRMPPAMKRIVDQTYARPEDVVSFADGFPVLVANEASLRDLNARLTTPVGMDRFRPNVVVDGLPAFAEEEIGTLSLGDTARLDLVKPCSRCSVVTVDPATAVRGKEPLATLASYRTRVDPRIRPAEKNGQKTFFAMNALVRSRGPVKVGDPVAFTPLT